MHECIEVSDDFCIQKPVRFSLSSLSSMVFYITELFIIEYLLIFQRELNSVDAIRGFILSYYFTVLFLLLIILA